MIDYYVNDIRKSLENKCYFSALSLALTLPDICGMAEYPEESVTKRYIDWYNRFPGMEMKKNHENAGGKCPWLSGEVIYNLRNTYLHQGAPTIDGSKVKEDVNQVDKFILVLGDGTVISESGLNIEMGSGMVSFKVMMVDVTYLCETLSSCALDYYKRNSGKFAFHFSVMPQKTPETPSSNHKKIDFGDFAASLLNQKWKKMGSHLKTEKKLGKSKTKISKAAEDQVEPLEESQKTDLPEPAKEKKEAPEPLKKRQTPKSGKRPVKKGPTKRKQEQDLKPAQKKKGLGQEDAQKKARQKREAQVRCFYGQHFESKDKREEIVQAVLQAKTKQQVNNNLMKIFPSEEAGAVYKKLTPLLKELPGR